MMFYAQFESGLKTGPNQVKNQIFIKNPIFIKISTNRKKQGSADWAQPFKLPYIDPLSAKTTYNELLDNRMMRAKARPKQGRFREYIVNRKK